MRAAIPSPRLSTITRQIALSYRFADVQAARSQWEAATVETCEAILDQAARFSADMLGPLNEVMDRDGCHLEDGRVVTGPEHREAWARFVADGWPTLEADEDLGGQGLPRIMAFAVQEQFDRFCPAFGMVSVPQRSLLKLIAAWGLQETRDEWLDKLVTGEWGATICVSEAGAGSDLGRIRTSAEPIGNGEWAVTGTKTWITFGDHDLTPQIGHAVLAQTRGEDGKVRPSLFLVPRLLDDGAVNAMSVQRIEEKLGLHGSPTCELGFDGARAILLGEQGRGLAQLFVMIANMRLAVGAMGLGIAAGAVDLAMQYAEERVQGGRPDPVPIANHADVKLQLMTMLSPVYLLRGLLNAAANCADLAETGDKSAAVLSSWLLPIVKNLGGEISFNSASGAIQVLGGAGYTAEWPAEQALRDARVLMVFEGTTGMQAQDLVLRRMVHDRTAYDAFVAEARKIAELRFRAALATFEAAAADVMQNPDAAEAWATEMLHMASDIAMAWIAGSYVEAGTGDPLLDTAANDWLDIVGDKVQARHRAMLKMAAKAERYEALRQALGEKIDA